MRHLVLTDNTGHNYQGKLNGNVFYLCILFNLKVMFQSQMLYITMVTFFCCFSCLCICFSLATSKASSISLSSIARTVTMLLMSTNYMCHLVSKVDFSGGLLANLCRSDLFQTWRLITQHTAAITDLCWLIPRLVCFKVLVLFLNPFTVLFSSIHSLDSTTSLFS